MHVYVTPLQNIDQKKHRPKKISQKNIKASERGSHSAIVKDRRFRVVVDLNFIN